MFLCFFPEFEFGYDSFLLSVFSLRLKFGVSFHKQSKQFTVAVLNTTFDLDLCWLMCGHLLEL